MVSDKRNLHTLFLADYLALKGTGKFSIAEGALILDVQFKKGTLELCVLCLLFNKDMYGYELVSEISEVIEISEGTIYPLLKRLKEEKLVTTYLRESQEGPPRKYYTLTDLGKLKKNELERSWRRFVKSMDKIIGGFKHE